MLGHLPPADSAFLLNEAWRYIPGGHPIVRLHTPSGAAQSGQESEHREGWPPERGGPRRGDPAGEDGWVGVQADRMPVPEAGEAADAGTSESGGPAR